MRSVLASGRHDVCDGINGVQHELPIQLDNFGLGGTKKHRRWLRELVLGGAGVREDSSVALRSSTKAHVLNLESL